MNIAVNLITMDPRYRGGINTYIQGLLGGFSQVASDDRYFLLCREDNVSAVTRFRDDRRFTVTALRPPAPAWRLLRKLAVLAGVEAVFSRVLNGVWSHVTRYADRAGDVVYTPTTFLTAFDSVRPSVVSMHDIQHVHFPQFFTRAERRTRRLYCDATSRVATAIQSSSAFIQSDLLAQYRHLTPDRVPVIHEGVDVNHFASAPAPSAEVLRSKYGLPERFVFYPAQLWPHKNHVTVLDALDELAGAGLVIPLVMTGAKYDAAPAVLGRIERSGLRGQVHYLGLVPFEDLVGLYRSAQYLINASLYESNCLPILEAAAAGTPVIASDIPPNKELLRDLQLNLFPRQDASALARVMRLAWTSGDRAAQAAHNRRSIEGYSWSAVARKYLDLFSRLAGQRSRN